MSLATDSFASVTLYSVSILVITTKHIQQVMTAQMHESMAKNKFLHTLYLKTLDRSRVPHKHRVLDTGREKSWLAYYGK